MEYKAKTCTKCEIEKELSKFYKDGTKFRSQCKVCYKLQKKQYYIQNTEKIIATHATYNNLNKEKIAKYQKEYYSVNIDHKLAKGQKYYKENREKMLKQKQIYGKEKRDKINK